VTGNEHGQLLDSVPDRVKIANKLALGWFRDMVAAETEKTVKHIGIKV
jgi:hypothetical protein